MVVKEQLSSCAEKYFKAEKLIRDDAKFDPATEPFFSKYAARQILLNLYEEISSILNTESKDSCEYLRLTGMQAATQLTLAIVAFDTEETSIGENHLKVCEDIVSPYEASKECAAIALVVYNEYGVYYHRLESVKGLEYLTRAESFYHKCKADNLEVWTINDLFTDEMSGEGDMKFEASFTLTLYFLAQVYARNNPLKSAIYCHRTIKRQLEAKDDTFDYIDWSLNAATLAQYFISVNCFKQARHHLAASSFVLKEYNDKLNAQSEDNEANNAKKEEYQHRSADVDRCWAKYCYSLLISSKERLLSENSVDIAYTDINLMNFHEKDGSINKTDTENLFFENVDLATFESIVTDQYISIYAEAKPVFLLALNYLAKAQEYYTLESMASDYIEIVQELSNLYSLTITFFEDNNDNCAKLYKRSIDILEKVLKQVNHKYYLKYCQEIWHRLGQLYSNILDLKLEKHKSNEGRPSPDSLIKINKLISKSICNFTAYINSVDAKKDLAEGLIEPYLMAHFNIAAISRKYITYDKRLKLQNAKKSLEHFEIVLNYCETHENAVAFISDYIPIAKELVRLIPAEIMRFEGELGISPSKVSTGLNS